jgi:S1-C subfamily serine protease
VSTPLLADDVFPALSRALADAAERAAPAIVQVFGRKRPASGVVIAPDRVLSTSHSVEWEEGVRVRTSDGRDLEARVRGHAHAADLVLLEAAGLQQVLAPAAPAAPRLGQLALVTGRSWGGAQQARLTTVSGLGGPLDTSDGTRLDRVIALPTSPYPGFSGSALIDPAGGLLGIATAGLFRGRALALPWPVAEPLVQSLERHGSMRRGYLGVTSQPVRLPAAQRGTRNEAAGLVVLGVADGSPAATAGLLVGDVLLAAGGEDIQRPGQLLAKLASQEIGTALVLSVLRGKERRDVSVTVGERPARW